MRLYCLIFDGEHYYVEAETMPEAISLWKQHVALKWGDDFDGTEGPESCEYVHDAAVIRAVAS